MRERISSVDRMVFSPEVPRENREALEHIYEDPFATIEVEGLEEAEKTERQLGILEQIDVHLNGLRRGFGLSEFHIPPEFAHIIPKESWRHEQPAHYDPGSQSTYFRQPDSDLVFGQHAFHEQLHQHTYGALEVLPGKEAPLIQYYRQGLEVYSRPDHRRHFEMLNEAVTACLEKQFIMALRERPEFEHERRETDKIVTMFKETKLPDGIVLDRDELFQLWIETVDGRRINLEELERPTAELLGGKRVGLQMRGVSYDRERKAFRRLVDKITLRSDSVGDERAVTSQFSKAAFTGNVMGIGKLLDRTFGPGTYRALGEQADEDSFSRFIDTL